MFNRMEQRLFRLAAVYSWIACLFAPLVLLMGTSEYKFRNQIVFSLTVVEFGIGILLWAVPWNRLSRIWIFFLVCLPVNLNIFALVFFTGKLQSPMISLYIFNIVFVYALLGRGYGLMISVLTLIGQFYLEWELHLPLITVAGPILLTLLISMGLGNMIALLSSMLQKNLKRTETMNEMTLSLNQLTNPEDVIQQSIQACVKETQFDFGILYALVENEEQVISIKSYGISEEWIQLLQAEKMELTKQNGRTANAMRETIETLQPQEVINPPLAVEYEGRPFRIRSLQLIPISHGLQTSILLLGSAKKAMRLKETLGWIKLLQPHLSTALLYVKQLRETGAALDESLHKFRTANEKLQTNYLNMVRTLIQTLEAKDRYTRGHSERVSEFASAIALKLGYTRFEMEDIGLAALLHDVGKIGVPDSVLLKAGKLTEAEWELMRQHPILGEEILQYIEFFEPFLKGVRSHHERMDGRGYPDGLMGDEIPLMARIIAVADAFDALTSTRAYREARTLEQAMQILLDGRGTQWDARCVDAFIEYINHFQNVDFKHVGQ